jgi:hypothetical protein
MTTTVETVVTFVLSLTAYLSMASALNHCILMPLSILEISISSILGSADN